MTIDTPSILHDTPPYTSGAYFNSAGASLMSRPVISAMVDHLHLESALGAYGAAAAMATELADLYSAAARLLGCDPDEVALTEGHASGSSRGRVGAGGGRAFCARCRTGGRAVTRRCAATGLRCAYRAGAQVVAWSAWHWPDVCSAGVSGAVDSAGGGSVLRTVFRE